MAIYTVHVPDDVPDQIARAERTRFVREGVSIRAFVFGLIFLVWHRLWLAAAGWIVFALAMGGLCWLLHVPSEAWLALVVLMRLFLGVEGNDLRRWGLERRGLRLSEVVSGASLAEAELSYFHRQPAPPASSRAMPPRVVRPEATPAVIGMFPDGGMA